jgi:hypothetical protein
MKRSNSTSNNGSNGHAKVSLFVLQMEGDASTLTKSIDSLVHAMSKPGGNALRAMTPTPPAVVLPAVADDVAEHSIEENSPPPAVEEAANDPAPTKLRKPRTFKIPDVLDELRANEQPDSFKDFVAGRAIEVDVDRALTVAMWLKQKRTVNEFDPRHLHTCFGMMNGWKLPDDPGSLLRNMKKRGFVRAIAGKPGVFELTSHGANRYQELG